MRYREAGGTGPTVLIRRVWIGEPPTAAIDAQMKPLPQLRPRPGREELGRRRQHHRWRRPPSEAAEKLVAVLHDSHCDTVNVRVQVAGLTPDDVRAQLELHADGFVDAVRAGLRRRADDSSATTDGCRGIAMMRSPTEVACPLDETYHRCQSR